LSGMSEEFFGGNWSGATALVAARGYATMTTVMIDAAEFKLSTTFCSSAIIMDNAKIRAAPGRFPPAAWVQIHGPVG